MSLLPAATMDHRRLAELRSSPLDWSRKGIPLGVTTSLDELPTHGWNVARGDLALPVTTLSATALESNIATMASYCRRHGAVLAPHGKTTMAPQLFARQLAAGAWGLTCATPTQAAVMRRFGVSRIVIANEVTEPRAWAWIVAEQEADPGLELSCLVDSAETVTRTGELLATLQPSRPVDLLLEVGVPGGRAGVRTVDEGVRVAEAVRAVPQLRLVGVEAYEGLVTRGGDQEDLARLDTFFARVRETTRALADAGTFGADDIIVTAGGSAYFDRVVACLSDWPELDRTVTLVLRSGCYISQDAGTYEELSPLAGRRADDEPLRLRNALTAWAAVLSRPEPGLVILGTGKRDVAHDLTLPRPRTVYRSDGTAEDLRGRAELFTLMDQHAFLRVSEDVPIRPGDIVALDCSHPCTAFDKVPFVPVIDDDNNVIDGIITFF